MPTSLTDGTGSRVPTKFNAPNRLNGGGQPTGATMSTGDNAATANVTVMPLVWGFVDHRRGGVVADFRIAQLNLALRSRFAC